jgi:hypothetical protein
MFALGLGRHIMVRVCGKEKPLTSWLGSKKKKKKKKKEGKAKSWASTIFFWPAPQ